jgi:hypothetical protein
MQPTVLVVGNSSRAEFAVIATELAATACWSATETAAEAERMLGESVATPDLIVLVQSRPGEVDAPSIERLRQVAPLSPMWIVLGSWCEGEARSGRPVAGVLRIYWHEWPLRWREELERLRLGQTPLWTLPVTMSDEERLLERFERSAADTSDHRGTVAIAASSRATESALIDTFRAAHFGILSSENPDGLTATAIIWDTTAWQATQRKLVKELWSRFGEAPIVALVTFPQFRDVEQMLAVGVAAVLAKPLLIDDACREIERLAIGAG